MRGHRGRKGIIEGGGRGGRDFSARQAPQAEQITIGGRTASLRIKAIPCRQRLLIAGSAKANAGWGRGGGAQISKMTFCSSIVSRCFGWSAYTYTPLSLVQFVVISII